MVSEEKESGELAFGFLTLHLRIQSPSCLRAVKDEGMDGRKQMGGACLWESLMKNSVSGFMRFSVQGWVI